MAVRAVLVNGDIVDCSPEEHTDLFWAMCGAGSAFAIAVELKLRLVDPPVRRPLGLWSSWLFGQCRRVAAWRLIRDCLPSSVTLILSRPLLHLTP